MTVTAIRPTQPTTLPDPNWRDRAACTNTEPEVFYALPNTLMEDYAKAVCRDCPVKRDCLQHALDRGEKFGIWGGLNEKERSTPVRVRLALRAQGRAA